jgi:S-adenosylmethionine synthetase
VMVETFGTETIPEERIAELVSEHFDLRPGAFREELRLRPLWARGRGLHVGAHRQG